MDYWTRPSIAVDVARGILSHAVHVVHELQLQLPTSQINSVIS